MKTKTIFALLLLFFTLTLAAQTVGRWYRNLPVRAVLSEDGAVMRIGGKNYQVYNALDPITPKAGERVIDYMETLNYYMWFHRAPNGNFVMSRIDSEMNIYYFDFEKKQFTTPGGVVMAK